MVTHRMARRFLDTVPGRGGTFTAGLDATPTAQTRFPQPSDIASEVPSYLGLRLGA